LTRHREHALTYKAAFPFQKRPKYYSVLRYALSTYTVHPLVAEGIVLEIIYNRNMILHPLKIIADTQKYT
jgi:hypothetical protein